MALPAGLLVVVNELSLATTGSNPIFPIPNRPALMPRLPFFSLACFHLLLYRGLAWFINQSLLLHLHRAIAVLTTYNNCQATDSPMWAKARLPRLTTLGASLLLCVGLLTRSWIAGTQVLAELPNLVSGAVLAQVAIHVCVAARDGAKVVVLS